MIIPVILSGGSGSRLWPLSRENHPKQFLALNGVETMLQATALRLTGFAGDELGAPVVVCNNEHRFMAAEQLQRVGIGKPAIMLEPVGRNTAPALTLAALQASGEGALDPVLLTMPADHVISDLSGFHAAVRAGLEEARSGAVVTFGIVPCRPETGYGYIRAGGLTKSGTLKLESFVEKPDLELARTYLSAGNYLWNSGIFMMRASVWLKAVQRLQPAMAEACSRAFDQASVDADFIRIDAEAFSACPSDSIDYAVMEHLGELEHLGIPGVVVPMEAGWSDVGAWDSLWDVSEKDAAGNSTFGEALLESCRDSLFYGTDRLIAAVGVEGLIVVETADAVLVADKRHTQDVKKVVARLKEDGKALANMHRKVYRPWGSYDSIDFGDRFQVKRIVVNPGAKLSLQMHHHRAEHWIVVRGTAEVTNGERTYLVGENESTYIPLGTVHRLANPGRVPLELIEVQSGSYLGEDDIIRFEDTYGRAPSG